MAYCGPRGLPHSFFLGGPHLWTQADRDKALAWQELDRQTCKGCGTRPEEWDPEQGGSRDAWEYVIDVCPGCERREATEARMQDKEHAEMKGKRIKVRKPKKPDPTASAGRRKRRR